MPKSCALMIFALFTFPLALFSQDTLTITYCDGKTQQVRLEQPQDQISNIGFSCGGSDFGSTQFIPGAFQGQVFAIDEGARNLPDFSQLRPMGSIYATKLDIPNQSFDKGFPGVTDRFEWFAIAYTGELHIIRGGTYEFRLNSDDGSRLMVDGQMIIDNDGQHGERSRSGRVDLSSGTHRLRVEYFQGPRHYVALQLFVTPPGASERILDLKQRL